VHIYLINNMKPTCNAVVGSGKTGWIRKSWTCCNFPGALQSMLYYPGAIIGWSGAHWHDLYASNL